MLIMHSSKNWLLVIFVTALNAGAQAADVNYSTTYSACVDESGGVKINMFDRMGGEAEQQDTRLNQNYKAAMQALAPISKHNCVTRSVCGSNSAKPTAPYAAVSREAASTAFTAHRASRYD